MATKRNRVTAEFGLGTPAAATFQAQNVPFIGAQRRESQASNFERLASSLGSFSSALGSFANSAQAMEKRQAKEAERAAKEAARVAKMSGGERRSERLRTGRDKNTDLLKDTSEFKALVIPEEEAKEQGWLNEMERGGWTIEAGTVEVDPETGAEGEWAKVPVTPDYLLQMHEKELKALDEQFPLGSDLPRKKLATKYQFEKTKRRIAALDDFREKKNYGDFYDIMTHSGGDIIKQAKALHPDDPDMLAQAFIDNSVRLAGEAGVEMKSKDFFTRVMPDLLKTITPQIEKDPELAAAVESLFQGRFGPARTTMLGHKRTMTGASAALNAAKRSLGKQQYDALVGQYGAAALEHLEKGNSLDTFEVPDVKIELPNKTYTLNKEEFKKGLAAERDSKILTVDGVVPKFSSPDQYTALAVDGKQTGLVSPTLKGLFEDVGYKEDEEDPTRLSSVLSAYGALKLHNPSAIKEYFKGRKEDKAFLDTTSAILESRKDLDVTAAAKFASEAIDSGGLKSFLAKNANKKLVTGIDGINAADGQEILKTAYSVAYATGEMDDKEMEATVKGLVADRLSLKPLVHGNRVDLPDGEDPQAGAARMTAWVSHIGSKINIDPTRLNVKYSAATGAYFVIDKKTNAPATDPKGNMVTFSYDQVVKFGSDAREADLKAKADEQNRQKQNRSDNKKNMKPVDWEKNPLWKMKN